MANCDFLIEKRLKSLNNKYHQLAKNTEIVLVYTLEKYKALFPEYTDHTISHSLQVLDFCNKLIGKENIKKLNADELYVLIMGTYLHDVGMGISKKDFKSFYKRIFKKDFIMDENTDYQKIVRNFHQEFSVEYIEKYKNIFEIPSTKHTFAICQIARGHRRSDLYDENLYPSSYEIDNDNTICLPYLASLIRLADEMDIASDRIIFDNQDDLHHLCHRAIKTLEITDDAFVYEVIKTNDDKVDELVKNTIIKLEDTFNFCKKVVEERTNFKIKQNKIIVKMI